jgi:hypothetical protein
MITQERYNRFLDRCIEEGRSLSQNSQFALVELVLRLHASGRTEERFTVESTRQKSGLRDQPFERAVADLVKNEFLRCESPGIYELVLGNESEAA